MWVASFEMLTQLDHIGGFRETLSTVQPGARVELAQLFHGHAAFDAEDQMKIGSLYEALLVGVLAQWLIAPESAPSGADLLEAVDLLARVNGSGEAPA